MEKNKEIDYFYYPLDRMIQFYYDLFISNWTNSCPVLEKYKNEILSLIWNELNSYEFISDRWQVKKDKRSLGIKKLNRELGHLTGIWSIDWEWIMHHIISDYQNINIALNLKNESEGHKIPVYKYVPHKYYEFAIDVYLKDKVTREPKIFDLEELFKNGFGLKENIKEFNPLIGATLWGGFNNEFWDLTELKLFRDYYYWNNDEKCFIYGPRKTERKVIRKSKIMITIGDKKFEI